MPVPPLVCKLVSVLAPGENAKTGIPEGLREIAASDLKGGKLGAFGGDDFGIGGPLGCLQAGGKLGCEPSADRRSMKGLGDGLSSRSKTSKRSNAVRLDDLAAYNLNTLAALAVVRARWSQDRRNVSRARRISLEAVKFAELLEPLRMV